MFCTYQVKLLLYPSVYEIPDGRTPYKATVPNLQQPAHAICPCMATQLCTTT